MNTNKKKFDPKGYFKHFCGGALIQILVSFYFIVMIGKHFESIFGSYVVGLFFAYLLQWVIWEWFIGKVIQNKKPNMNDNWFTFLGVLLADLTIALMFVVGIL